MPQLLCVSNPNVYDRIDYADRSTICIVHVSLSDAFLRSIFKTQLFNVGTGVGTRVQVSLGGWTQVAVRVDRCCTLRPQHLVYVMSIGYVQMQSI